MFRKGKSAKLTNKIGAFILIITAGTLHRIQRVSKGVFNLNKLEKVFKEGDLIPESIQKLFRDEEIKPKIRNTMNFQEGDEFFQSQVLKKMLERDTYNENLRNYENYRKYSILMRVFRKK